MLCTERRETTRKEDQVYSLLGIFDVYMPLIYGKGKEHAMERLREIIKKYSKGKHLIPLEFLLLLMILMLTRKSGLDSDLLHYLPYTVEA